MLIKTSSPQVSILMAVFNNQCTVFRAIKSILNQTFEDFEFLILNDASTDSSWEIINSFKDKRIKVINNQRNLGLTRSLNKLIKLSRGKYIARMDADDVSLPTRLDRQFKFLSDNPEFILLGSSYHIINNKEKIIKEVKYNTSPERIYYDITFQNIFAHSSVIFQRDKIISLGGYNQKLRYAQDFSLWYKLTREGKTWIMPDILIQWNDSKVNISSNKYKEQSITSRKIFIDNLRELGVNDKVLEEAIWFHNYYSKDYLNCPRDKLRKAFDSLMEISVLLIKKAPTFYNRNMIEEIVYRNLVDLLASIYKNTPKKPEVLFYVLRNICNYKLDKRIFRKIVNFLKNN